jgi:hypothetical protein
LLNAWSVMHMIVASSWNVPKKKPQRRHVTDSQLVDSFCPGFPKTPVLRP